MQLPCSHEVDIAGAFMEQLMKSRIEKPDGKLAHGVPRLKPEFLACGNADERQRYFAALVGAPVPNTSTFIVFGVVCARSFAPVVVIATGA